jgi:hypothetical protein
MQEIEEIKPSFLKIPEIRQQFSNSSCAAEFSLNWLAGPPGPTRQLLSNSGYFLAGN